MERLAPRAAIDPPSLRGEWPFVACLALFFVAAAAAVGADRNVPVIDDWTYAWSVEQLLEHGRLAMLDWSAVFPVGPALWGAAWSLVFGFSFVTLRVSTLVLALVACSALYFILRELEASPRLALLGALSVAANPAFLLLSSSFMTDVPFIALTLLALLYYTRAIRRGEPAALWWGGLWACVSCLDRQVGVLTPIAALPLIISPPGRISRAAAAWPIGATWAAMLAGSLVVTTWLHPTGEMGKLVDRLGWLFHMPLTQYITYNLYVLLTVAFYALPALLAMAARGLWRGPAVPVATAAVAALLFALVGDIPLPLRPNNTWTLREVGGARQLINGAWPAFQWTGLEYGLRALGVLALALAVLAIIRRERVVPAMVPSRTSSRGSLRGAVTALADGPWPARTPLVVYGVAYLALVNVLWFYNDRYVLVLLPIAVALVLGQRTASTGVPRLAWAVTALYAVVAVAGTRDTLRFNQEVRDSWQALVDSGVRPSDIDAGYAWTGWMLYAHPENLANGLTVNDVPWVTSKRRPPYLISKERLDGYDVAREIVWGDDAPWPGPDRLYILKQRPLVPAPRPVGKPAG